MPNKRGQVSENETLLTASGSRVSCGSCSSAHYWCFLTAGSGVLFVSFIVCVCVCNRENATARANGMATPIALKHKRANACDRVLPRLNVCVIVCAKNVLLLLATFSCARTHTHTPPKNLNPLCCTQTHLETKTKNKNCERKKRTTELSSSFLTLVSRVSVSAAKHTAKAPCNLPPTLKGAGYD